MLYELQHPVRCGFELVTVGVRWVTILERLFVLIIGVLDGIQDNYEVVFVIVDKLLAGLFDDL